MERINFRVEVPEEILEERKKLANELKKNELVINFVEKTGCTMKIVEDYPYRFKSWIEGLKRCQKCSGLKSCQQENRGQVYDLRYNGYLDFVLRPCRYSRIKKEEEAHLSHIVINDMPSSLYSVSMDKLTIDNDNMECISEMMNWLENPCETGFYLRGPVGTGKSTLAAVACNFMARRKVRTAFVNVPAWVSRMKTLLDDPQEYEKQIRILSKVDFAVFDDIGAESVTPWARDELLFPILNIRMEEGKMTWFTSNEDWESLEAHYSFSAKYGEEKMKAVRIMERIKSMAKIVKLSGKNRRNHNE